MPAWTPIHRTISNGIRISPTPWDRSTATIFAALRRASPLLPAGALGMAVPQGGCTFSFGAGKGPLTAGALLRIWGADGEATAGAARFVAGTGWPRRSGGLLNVGVSGALCGLRLSLVQAAGRSGLPCTCGCGQLLEGTPWYPERQPFWRGRGGRRGGAGPGAGGAAGAAGVGGWGRSRA